VRLGGSPPPRRKPSFLRSTGNGQERICQDARRESRLLGALLRRDG
jgi:hypothetical protein